MPLFLFYQYLIKIATGVAFATPVLSNKQNQLKTK